MTITLTEAPPSAIRVTSKDPAVVYTAVGFSVLSTILFPKSQEKENALLVLFWKETVKGIEQLVESATVKSAVTPGL